MNSEGPSFRSALDEAVVVDADGGFPRRAADAVNPPGVEFAHNHAAAAEVKALVARWKIGQADIFDGVGSNRATVCNWLNSRFVLQVSL